MENPSLYQSADFFMARYANLPFQTMLLLDQGNEALIHFYQNNPLFREAIAVASFDLHQALKKWDRIPDKTSFYMSLSKYLIRMSSRATPFGYFSSVGWGRFSEKTEMSFDPSNFKKRVSLGAECIGEFIQALQKNQNVVRQLKVMLNPQLIYKNGRVFLNNDHPEFLEDYISIKITTAFNLVYSLAKEPIEYRELEEKLVLHFTIDRKEKAQAYLWELFQRNYLISHLVNPSILAHFSDKYAQILERVNNASIPSKVIQESLKDICEYQNSPQGEKIELLEKVMQELKGWKKEIKNPLRIDHFYDSSQILLHQNVRRAVEKAADVLARISFSQDLPENLSAFHRVFNEHYGSDRLVPFFELCQNKHILDLIWGRRGADRSNEISAIDSFFAMQSQQEEINIEAFVNALPPLTRQQQQIMSPTMELYFEIEARDTKEIEQNRFKLLMKGISHQAGSMFGRFLYFWEEDKIKELSNFIENEKKLFTHLHFVEATFVPEKGKAGNVSIGTPLRPMQLPMHYHEENECAVDLEDIYIGADHRKVYLFSKKLNKELFVSSGVMTNPLFMPFPLRLLLSLSQFQMRRFSGSIWDKFNKRVYFPRVVYENIVISPMQWHFTYSFLNIDSAMTKEKLHQIVREAFKKYRIPSKVLMVQHDNHLQLDMNNDLHFDVLLKEFMKTKEITLHEQRDKKDCLFVGSKEASHVCEFVVPIVKNQSLALEESGKSYPRTTQVQERVFFPGGDWWYAKLFLPSNEADLFLSRFLLPYMQSLEKQFEIPRWFFIRYNEEGFHIRLRVNANTDLLKQEMLPQLNQWAAALVTKGEVEDFSLCSYKPELERYGGPDCIALAENFFCEDSRCAVKILANPDPAWPLYLIASFGIINLLQRFYPDVKNMLKVMSTSQDQAKLLDGIRPYSKVGIEFAKSILMKQEITIEHVYQQFLMNCFSQTHLALDRLAEKLSELEKQGEAWNPLNRILDSLVHMHCNRLLGTSPLLEQKARVAAAYLIEKVSHQFHNAILH